MANKIMKTLNGYEIFDEYARNNISSILEILSKPIKIECGGTNATNAADALKNLGITATATKLNFCANVASDIQAQLNGKAGSNHGEHVTYGTTTSALGSAASGGSTNTKTVSRSDHVHPFPALASCPGTLDIGKGGTNATDKDTACANLGAVKKSGDTMTGDLTVPNLKMHGSNTDKMIEVFSSGNALACGILLDADDSKRRISFNSYNKDQDKNTNKCYERYLLPSADSGLTVIKRYKILTTKNSGTSLPSTGEAGDIFFLY